MAESRLAPTAFHAIVDAEPVAVALYEPVEGRNDLRVAYANPVFESLSRLHPVDGRLFTELWPTLVDSALPKMLDVLATGEPWAEKDLEIPVEEAGGSIVTQHFLHHGIRIEMDGSHYVLVVMSESTRSAEEQTALATELRESLDQQMRLTDELDVERSQLRAVFDTMAEGVALWLPDGTLLDLNQAMVRMHGYADKQTMMYEMVHGPVAEMRALDGRELEPPEYPGQRIIAGETVSSIDLLIDVPSTGVHLVASFSGAPVRDRDGCVLLGVMTAHDITERFEAQRTARRELAITRSLLEAADAMSSWTDLDELLRGLADITLRSVAHKRATIGLLAEDASEVTVVATAGDAAIVPGMRVPWDDVSPSLRRVFEQARSAVVDYDALPHDERGVASRFMGRYVLIVPLAYSDHVFGYIAIDDPGEHREFTQREIEIAEGIASQAAVAIENARLFETVQQTGDYAARLNDIDEVLHSTLELDDMSTKAVQAVAQALNADAVWVSLIDGDEFVVKYTYGERAEQIRDARLSRDEAQFSAMALESEGPLWSEDTQTAAHEGIRMLHGIGVAAVIRQRLYSRGKPLGVLVIDFYRPCRFSPVMLDFVRRVGVALSLAMENAQLYQSERGIADRLQEALLALPKSLPGVEFAHAYHSAAESARVGGDFYDIFQVEHDLIGITMGDVAGKGLDAAVLTSLVKNTIRAHASEKGATPAHILSLTNDIVYRTTTDEAFVTVFFAVLDCRDGCLVYANAGHTSPAIVGPDRDVGPLGPTGPILGAFPDATFAENEVCIAIGESLFLYTDGLTEARSGDEFFDESRVFELLDRVKAEPPATLVRSAVDEVMRFSGGRLSDDLALLAVRRTLTENEPAQSQKIEV